MTQPLRPFHVLFLALAIAQAFTSSAARADEVDDIKSLLANAASTETQQIEACRSLERIGPKAAPAVNALIVALGQPDPLRYHAGRALVAIGAPAAPSLRLAAEIGAPPLRHAALDAWAAIDSGASADVLMLRLDDPSPALRSQAALALTYRDPERRIVAKLDLMRDHDPDEGVREIAAESARMIEGRVAVLVSMAQDEAKRSGNVAVPAEAKLPDAKSRLQELVAISRQGRISPQIQAIELLGKLGRDGEKTAPALRVLLDSPSYEIQWAAAKALMTIGPDSVPQWLDAMKSKDDVVRRLAYSALGDPDLLVRPAERPTVEMALASALKEPRPSAQAADALCSYWPTSAELITQLLKDGNETLMKEVIDRLLVNPSTFGVYERNGRRPLSHKDWYDRPSQEVSAEFANQVAPRLLHVLAKGNDSTRPGSLAALLHLPTDLTQVTRTLVRSMASADPNRAKEAADMLSEFTSGPLPALIAGMKDGDPGVRLVCTRVLAAHEKATEDENAIKAMTAALTDHATEVRHAALPWAARLTYAPPMVVSRLAATILPGEFHAASSADRAMAVKAIGDLAAEPGSAVFAILAALDDSDAEVQQKAIVALRSFASAPHAEAAIPRLKALAGQKETRRQAAMTLALLGPEGQQAAAPIMLEALRQAATDADRLEAVNFLASAGPQSAPAVPELQKLLTGSDNTLRMAVADALGAIGPAARPATPDLIRMVDNRQPDVRRRAAAALVRIAPDGAGLAPALVAAVENADTASSNLLASTLRRLDDRAALLRRLQNIAQDDPENAVRAAARRAADALAREGDGRNIK